VDEPVGLPVLFDGELTREERRHLHYCELGLEGGELFTSGIYGWAMVVTGEHRRRKECGQCCSLPSQNHGMSPQPKGTMHAVQPVDLRRRSGLPGELLGTAGAGTNPPNHRPRSPPATTAETSWSAPSSHFEPTRWSASLNFGRHRVGVMNLRHGLFRLWIDVVIGALEILEPLFVRPFWPVRVGETCRTKHKSACCRQER
jgi:hypothetical protein